MCACVDESGLPETDGAIAQTEWKRDGDIRKQFPTCTQMNVGMEKTPSSPVTYYTLGDVRNAL